MFSGLNRKVVIAILVGVILVTFGGGVVWYLSRSFHPTAQPSPSPSTLSRTDTSTVSQIKQLLGIPDSENPTIADITDSTKMASQPFFANSQNGDQVLVFAQSKKIVLYRPSSGKVINLAPLNDEGSASAQLNTASSSATPVVTKVLVRNGTTTKGLASKIQSQIKQIVPGSQTGGENAAKTDYPTSVIVVLNSAAQAEAQLLSQKLGIIIGELPEGEKKPTNQDLVIILGQDQAK